MNTPKQAVEARLDSILRGEIAAAETYHIALEHVDQPELEQTLREIQEDHGEAIRFLYAQLADRGVEPSNRPGAWGTFARSIEGVASRVSDKTALSALREGEKIGLTDYEAALEESALPIECTQRIEQDLLPKQRKHVDALSRWIEAR